MSDTTETMVKLARLPDFLSAARLLYQFGLIDEEPAAIIKRYVQANPDINAAIGSAFSSEER